MEIIQQRAGQFQYTEDEMARMAGKDIYETPVGMLRRIELWRLGNAWGMNFPAGATKDYMLPFFKQLEAEGKNPLRPPTGNLDTVIRQREVSFNGQDHSEKEIPNAVVENPNAIKPEPKDDFALDLEKMHMGQLRKICKLRGISQTQKDRKQDLIERLAAFEKGKQDEQNAS